ncbi:hypothetical protein H5410_035656 [Solanum commersonii]|uniref:Uncharacterized protein n=1 Tax=Solanum commersonii TaxID=4109 RepID=A0A9J5Y4C4_SOLCO|nr:hypothetical protein H5410_035656 [Solanum commersonii]
MSFNFNYRPQPSLSSDTLQCIPNLITLEDNNRLCIMPDEKEIKEVVFDFSVLSAAGPNRYNGTFFQSCWDIIKKDIIAYVQDFFRGIKLTRFIPFSMPPNCPNINYLDYDDAIVIFSSGNTPSMRLITNWIKVYESSSGQLVNRDKSFFLLTSKTSARRINRLRRCTNFMDKNFSSIYLGFPLYVGRKKLEYFD